MSDSFYHPLSPEQAYYARARFNEWLRIKEQNEVAWEGSRHEPATEADDEHSAGYRRIGKRRYKDGDLTFLAADIDHSALLFRLLIGLSALPEPPPLRRAYPVYPE